MTSACVQQGEFLIFSQFFIRNQADKSKILTFLHYSLYLIVGICLTLSPIFTRSRQKIISGVL